MLVVSDSRLSRPSKRFAARERRRSVLDPGEIKASPMIELLPPRRHRLGPFGPRHAPLVGVDDDGPDECGVSRADVTTIP